jgi:hypothetical protein
MLMKAMFFITQNKKNVVRIDLEAPTITNAEQDIVVLDENGKAAIVIQVQPGFDRESFVEPR